MAKKMAKAFANTIMKKKRLAILGSTGSIGKQALDVVRSQSEHFAVAVLAANKNADLLIEQAVRFQPKTVVIADQNKYLYVKDALSSKGITVCSGEKALLASVKEKDIDMVLCAIVGFAGLSSTLAAIQAGKDIALANKETLVVAGDLIIKLARQKHVTLLPVDSEHSAIFQCLVGEVKNPIEKIYLTASGGPFRGKNETFLQRVTKEQALQHPNWTMGAKITIDCATLMNKGLEVIEAKWLFDLTPKQIDVIVHPQSVIHSLVQFQDGSMKAQMGFADMKLPIQYAFSYPQRLRSSFLRFDFSKYPSLTFEKPDTKTFRCLDLAYRALKKAGNMPCILNAANEVAVLAFLQDKIGLLKIAEIVEKCMQKMSFVKDPSYEDYITTDYEARAFAKKLI